MSTENDAPVPDGTDALSPSAAAIRDAYAFEGARIHLGAMVEGEEPNPAVAVNLAVGMLNRHGLIAGATGTGKTRALQVIADRARREGRARGGGARGGGDGRRTGPPVALGGGGRRVLREARGEVLPALGRHRAGP